MGSLPKGDHNKMAEEFDPRASEICLPVNCMACHFTSLCPTCVFPARLSRHKNKIDVKTLDTLQKVLGKLCLVMMFDLLFRGLFLAGKLGFGVKYFSRPISLCIFPTSPCAILYDWSLHEA